MIQAFGFVPMPPLLRPEVASGAAAELDDLREAIDAVVAELAASAARLVILAPETAIELGRWIVERQPGSIAVQVIAVPQDPNTDETSAAVSELLAAARTDVAVLALGDGSACRSLKAPGYLDERALPFDEDLARWLADADVDSLSLLDQTTAAELLAAGRAVWPVCAIAAAEQSDSWVGELTFNDDPYGVAYFVAIWRSGSTGIPKLID